MAALAPSKKASDALLKKRIWISKSSMAKILKKED